MSGVSTLTQLMKACPQSTLSDGQKMPKSPQKWAFEPNFLGTHGAPNFSHARMARSERLAGATKRFSHQMRTFTPHFT